MDSSGWKRVFLGNAMDVDIDASSRVLIAPELRASAGLVRDVMLLGMGSHFELWDARAPRRARGRGDAVADARFAEEFQLLTSRHGSALQHLSVLLREAVDALVTDVDGIYVDGTFGRGGHSRPILERLSPHGRVVAIDRDPAGGRERGDRRRHSPTTRASRSATPRSRNGGDAGGASASRRSAACCSTSASRRRRSTIRSAASRSASTARSTCAWTPRAARAPPSSWPAPTSATLRR